MKTWEIFNLLLRFCYPACQDLDKIYVYFGYMYFQVAQHLASTYGDKAYKVAKMATLTGKRWPVVGRRLHEEYPYLEAEVKLLTI